MSSVHVLKFGGTSIKDASFIKQAVDIIAERRQNARPVVVVSAVAGVTDRLISLADRNGEESNSTIDELQQFHLNLLEQLASKNNDIKNSLITLFDELRQVALDTAKRLESPRAWRDEVLSFGERASVRLLEAALTDAGISARHFEAQQFIKTDSAFGEANVMADPTRRNIRDIVNFTETVPVITGFIGSTENGIITTLGRSGSDYTASLVADALDADHFEIWTDVNGVLTADPDLVPAAQSIEALNFGDIAELATHGVGVIHSKTIQPIRNRDISMQVRSSYEPDHPGTRIHQSVPSNGNFRSVTVKGPFVVIRVDKKHANAFRQLVDRESQSQGADSFSHWQLNRDEPPRFLLDQSLFDRVAESLVDWTTADDVLLDIRHDVYKVKKFSNNLKQKGSAYTQLFDALYSRHIHPIAVSQNDDQRHITLLFSRDDALESARIINDYWTNNKKTIHLFIAGTGAVGGTLTKQLDELNHEKFDFNVLGRCDSKTVQWTDEEQPTEWSEILKKLRDYAASNIIFVDATGSEEVARLYPDLFEAGIHVVTPSKLANTFEQSFYNKLRKTADANNVTFRYETTVGAGLPVISTLDDLVASGDTVTEISGVVSGTMTYLFDQLEQGVPFSDAIIDAREKGYAEPDPRDDLSGEDVARKFLTLAREIGWKIERDELEVESLIPEGLGAVDQEAFLDKLHAYDEEWKQKLDRAHDHGSTLRYTGQWADGKITIGVQEVPVDSPLGQLKGTDNLIRIYTRRYHQTPIIIQGPGAGKEVTAAGVLSDIIKLSTIKN